MCRRRLKSKHEIGSIRAAPLDRFVCSAAGKHKHKRLRANCTSRVLELHISVRNEKLNIFVRVREPLEFFSF